MHLRVGLRSRDGGARLRPAAPHGAPTAEQRCAAAWDLTTRGRTRRGLRRTGVDARERSSRGVAGRRARSVVPLRLAEAAEAASREFGPTSRRRRRVSRRKIYGPATRRRRRARRFRGEGAVRPGGARVSVTHTTPNSAILALKVGDR